MSNTNSTTTVKLNNVNYQKLANAWYSADGKLAPAAIVAQLESSAQPIEKAGEFWAEQPEAAKPATKKAGFLRLESLDGEKIGKFSIYQLMPEPVKNETGKMMPNWEGTMTLGEKSINISGWSNKAYIALRFQTPSFGTAKTKNMRFCKGTMMKVSQAKPDSNLAFKGSIDIFNKETDDFESIDLAGFGRRDDKGNLIYTNANLTLSKRIS